MIKFGVFSIKWVVWTFLNRLWNPWITAWLSKKIVGDEKGGQTINAVSSATNSALVKDGWC